MPAKTGHDLLPHTARKAPQMGVLKYRLLALLSVVGPGFITANVDNDSGGILTYSQAGAKYGYALLWTLVPTTIALIAVQEMASRMAAATGKGLSDLIREEFGLRITFFTMVVLGLRRSRQHIRGVRRNRVGHGYFRSEQIRRCTARCGVSVVRDRKGLLQAG
jgi:hypothetical protein